MDIRELSPAPWTAWQNIPTGSNDWSGKACVGGLPFLSVDRSPCFRETDAAFIALARNAFDGDPEALAWWEANRRRREQQ